MGQSFTMTDLATEPADGPSERDRVAAPSRSVVTAVFVALLLGHLVFLYSTLPTAEQYKPEADEGIYFHQATVVADRGTGGFAVLAREYLDNPSPFPSPNRIGHVLAIAAAISVDRSFRALSLVSLIAFAALSLSTFVFVRRVWNDGAALASGILVMTSPLAMGLSRRALMDTHYALFVVLAFLAFLAWTTTRRPRDFALFTGALIWALLVKETAFFFLPAFLAALVLMRWNRADRVTWAQVAVVVVCPLIVLAVYAALLGGVQETATLVSAMQRVNTAAANTYLAAYSSGPWFEFFVDSLVLSPIATILFLMGNGWYARSSPKTRATTMLLGAFWLALVCLMPLPQNPRFALPVDVLLRIGLGVLIVTAASRAGANRGRLAAAVAVVAMVASSDLVAFHRVFVANATYDPVAYNLLSSRGFFPAAARPPITADSYVTMSLNYYRAGDFDAAIEMSERAIVLAPDNAAAYNNIGAAYSALGRWREAIGAFDRALQLRPDFPLARNNLAWARAELAKTPQ